MTLPLELLFEGEIYSNGQGTVRVRGLSNGGDVDVIVKGLLVPTAGTHFIQGSAQGVIPEGGGGSGEAIRFPVHSVGHGLVVGMPITETAGGWVKSVNTNPLLVADAVVGEVVGPDDFIGQQFGIIEQPEALWEALCDMSIVGAGLLTGHYFWVSYIDGNYTIYKPDGVTSYQQIGFKALSPTTAEILLPSDAFISGGGGATTGSGSSVTVGPIHQVGHGLIVGRPLANNGTFVAADIGDPTKPCIGLVSAVTGPDDFSYVAFGKYVATAAQLDAIMGTTGGPAAGTWWALGPAGTLTTTPVGPREQIVCLAISNTELFIDRGDLITVGGSYGTTITNDLNLYVNVSGGNDSNSGLSSGAAFATIQHAVDVAATYRSLAVGSAYPSVIINLANGTYTEAVSVTRCSAQIKFTGSTSAVWNCTTAGAWALAIFGSVVTISGITFGGGATSKGIIALDDAILTMLGGHVFNQMSSQHLAIARCSVLYISGNYTISGSALIHYGIYDTSSMVFIVNGITITVSGTPAFSVAFCDVGRLGSINAGDIATLTFSGAATGKRYQCYNGGQIWTAAKGVNLFPGSVAGTVGSSGAYT